MYNVQGTFQSCDLHLRAASFWTDNLSVLSDHKKCQCIKISLVDPTIIYKYGWDWSQKLLKGILIISTCYLITTIVINTISTNLFQYLMVTILNTDSSVNHGVISTIIFQVFWCSMWLKLLIYILVIAGTNPSHTNKLQWDIWSLFQCTDTFVGLTRLINHP